ncbi:MAG TPA: hypothetical protein PKC27_05970 [Methanomethylovorans sp.]|nr:hypothetical protein [Methanomethylovorans sp.]
MKIPEEMIKHPTSSFVTIRYESFVIDISEKTDLQLLAEVLKTLRSVC